MKNNCQRFIISFIFSLLCHFCYPAETGLFTYEGGFFVKKGMTWKEYRPKDKPGLWAEYTQYGEEEHYYNISNNNTKLAIPKTEANSFYISRNGNWEVVHKTRVIYNYFTDTSTHLFCFTSGYYVRDGKKWRLYLPNKKSDLWCDFLQYDEDDKYFYLRNDSDKVCVPKRADLNCFLWKNGKWEANYSITEIYDHI